MSQRTTVASEVLKKPKRRKMTRRSRNNINGFLFALPWIIGFLCFSAYPLICSLYYSCTSFSPVTQPVWIGLKNYINVFHDPIVRKSLKNTLFMSFISTPVNLLCALSLGMICAKQFKAKGVVRTIFFLPSVIPMVAGTMVWIWMFDPTYGIINSLLSKFGIKGPSWLLDPMTTKWSLVMMGVWHVGTAMLVIINAIQEVSSSYYEAAKIDGANAWQSFTRITVPGIAHVIVYQAILNLLNSFQYFQQVYIIIRASSGNAIGLASGGPANSILMYPLYIFQNAFTYMDMGKASAMAWLLFIVVAIMTVFMTKATKKATEDMGGE